MSTPPGPEPGSAIHRSVPIELIVAECLQQWTDHPRWRYLDMEKFLCDRFACGHVTAVDAIAQARHALRESALKPELADWFVHAYLKSYEKLGELAEESRVAGKLSAAVRSVEAQARIVTYLARHMGLDAPMRVEVATPTVAKVAAQRFADLDLVQLEALSKLDVRVVDAQDSTATKEE